MPPASHRSVRCSMTTSNTLASTPKSPPRFRLPDIPEKHPDDMTSFSHLAANGNAHFLAVHLGKRETTIVSGERYVCRAPGAAMRYPDLLVAFGADPALYELSNGYIVSEQGKPPSFALEIASRRTRSVDTGEKRNFYEELGIGEYWRFDETGEFHGARLGGDLLVEGRYEPIAIEELDDGSLRGYSAALGLYLYWEGGELAFYDAATGEPIATLEGERARADAAEAYAETEHIRADTQQARAEREREARLRERQVREAAEARVREMEERLRSREE